MSEEIAIYRMKRILVPTDFSEHSRKALQYATFLAELGKGSITLLHVDEFDVSPLGYFKIEEESVLAYRRKKAEFFQEKFKSLQRDIVPDSVPLETLVLSGRSYKVIIEEAEREHYDLIVIATHGLTGISSQILGSTAERVVRFSRIPVLSLRDSDPSRKVKISRVLCPTDFSPSANIALTYALSLAHELHAKLYVQHISELESGADERDVMQVKPNLDEYYEKAEEVNAEFIFDRDIEPSNSIIRFAEDREIDLIVMSTHGRKGLRRVYIGNNTAEVVRQAPCPVLTVTHPLHKMAFARPATQEAQPFPIAKG